MTSRPRVGLVLLTAVSVMACSVRLPAPSSQPPDPLSPRPSVRPSETLRIVPSASAIPPVVAWDEGWRHSVVCAEPPDETSLAGCQASLVDVDGSDLPGWPLELVGPCQRFVTSAAAVLFTACRDNANGTIATLIHALGIDGAELAGWPIRLAGRLADLSWNTLEYGCGDPMPAMAVGPGAVYVALDAAGPPELRAIDFGGALVDGFPRRLPGDGTTICDGGFVLAPDGSIRAWGYEGAINDGGLGYSPFARRTVFEAIAPDGSTMPGWPIGATGTSSGAIVDAAGTLLHVTEAGDVWAHDPAGNSGPEWPYVLPYPARPYPTPDGRLVFLVSEQAGDRVIALQTGGGLAPGWPVDLAGHRESVCLAVGVDCFGFVQPAIGPDGTLYLSLASEEAGGGGTIVALDPAGAIVPGWPFRFRPRTRALNLRVDAAGNLIVDPYQCIDDICTDAVESDSLLIRPSGEVAGN